MPRVAVWSPDDPILSSYFVKQMKVSYLSYRNFTYIIVDKSTRHAAIVDPSWQYQRIAATLEQLGVTLAAILLTHSHLDHVYSVESLLAHYPSQVYMSGEEIDYYGFRCARLNAVRHEEIIHVGKTPVACIHTPGHTAGGTCYLLNDAFFTGDTIFDEGCGICSLPGGNVDKMFESVQLVKKNIHGGVRIYPGHSFGKEPGRHLQDIINENIYFQLDRKEHFTAFRMRSNFSGALDFR